MVSSSRSSAGRMARHDYSLVRAGCAMEDDALLELLDELLGTVRAREQRRHSQLALGNRRPGVPVVGRASASRSNQTRSHAT